MSQMQVSRLLASILARLRGGHDGRGLRGVRHGRDFDNVTSGGTCRGTCPPLSVSPRSYSEADRTVCAED